MELHSGANMTSSSTKTVISTAKGNLDLHVCKDGTVEGAEWAEIYNISFPADERQDLDELRMCMKAGSMELDETRDQSGRILCMTVTEVFRPHHRNNVPFLLACYTAVVPEFRGLGIGSVHRNKLADLLRSEYDDYHGIFTEIVSTTATGFDEQEMEIRRKRKRFFLKLGLRPININYEFPSAVDPTQYLQGELLWLPFSNDIALTRDDIADVLQRIYTQGYGMRANDPFVSRMLNQIR
jgi:hypothetical protein